MVNKCYMDFKNLSVKPKQKFYLTESNEKNTESFFQDQIFLSDKKKGPKQSGSDKKLTMEKNIDLKKNQLIMDNLDITDW